MKRRDFIGGLAGAAAAWPLIARAQSSAPVIGFLSGRSLEDSRALMTEFHKGLSESGYVEGKNVSIEYRWAEGDYGRLPAMAADLVARRVRLIATTGGSLTAAAAKEATGDIPIIFAGGGDPIQLGLVASLSRPAGNVTGVSLFISELGTKRLDFLRQLAPAAKKVGILANPKNPASGLEARDIQVHANGTGIDASIFTASPGSFDQVFAAMASENVQALVVANDPFLIDTRQAFIQQVEKRAIPTIYFTREFVDAGGLISYGASIRDAYHKVGAYVGQVLNGASPGDLPVQQPTKFELLLNLAAAKTLGLTIPPSLLARADEVIE